MTRPVRLIPWGLAAAVLPTAAGWLLSAPPAGDPTAKSAPAAAAEEDAKSADAKSGVRSRIPEKYLKLLESRNYFVPDPPEHPPPPTKPETPPPPADDPADLVVVTGIFDLGGKPVAVLEDLSNRGGQFLGVGDKVAGSQREVVSIDPGRETVVFRLHRVDTPVALGGNLTGRRMELVRQKLGTPAPAAGTATFTAPAAAPGGTPPAGASMEGRINRASGISNAEADVLLNYFREREERERGVRTKGKKPRDE
jgi:hypothetical protein